MSFKLAVRTRLPTDVEEAFVEVRERLLFCGEVGEWGLDGALCPGESGCGNGTGVGTLALGDAMMAAGSSTVKNRKKMFGENGRRGEDSGEVMRRLWR